MWSHYSDVTSAFAPPFYAALILGLLAPSLARAESRSLPEYRATFAALYLAPEIIRHAHGCQLKPMTGRWAIEPCLKGEPSLVTSDPEATRVFPFTGTSVGARLDPAGRGFVDLYLDGRRIGTHGAKQSAAEPNGKAFSGRANLYHGRDRLPAKHVDRALFRENPRTSR